MFLACAEARAPDLNGLDIDEVSEMTGCEFFIRLRKPDPQSAARPAAALNDRRGQLLRRIIAEYAAQAGQDASPKEVRRTSAPMTPLRRMSRKVRGLGRKLRGKPA